MSDMPTLSSNPGGGCPASQGGVWLPILDRSQRTGVKWYLTGHRLGLMLILARAAGLGYDQKHKEMETSVPKSGPRRLNLPPTSVCGGGGREAGGLMLIKLV